LVEDWNHLEASLLIYWTCSMRFLKSWIPLELVIEAHVSFNMLELPIGWLLGYERQQACVERVFQVDTSESSIVFSNLPQKFNLPHLPHSFACKRVLKSRPDSRGENWIPTFSGGVARSHCKSVLGGNYY
jgi:hypothetical protein